MAQNGGDNGYIVQAMNNLIQTLANGQQRLVEVHRDIQQERRFEERVPNCDGGGVESHGLDKRTLSSSGCKQGVGNVSDSRGTLLKTIQDFEASHPHTPWAE